MTPQSLAAMQRRRTVAARYVRGEAQWSIAQSLEVNPSTICRDLKVIHQEWLEQAVQNMDTIKARELAKIDEAERQAWAAWTKSQENAEVLRAKMRGQGTSETEKIVKGSSGNPKFLELILHCVDQRCKILGVYDGKKGEGDGEYGSDLDPDTAARLLEDAIARLGGTVGGSGESGSSEQH